MMKTVAIIGSHPDTRALAPFDDTNVDIWVVNEAPTNGWCPRVSAVFQMHRPEVYRSPVNRSDAGHWGWLQQPHGYPIFMLARDELVPDSVRYPLDELLARFGCERYFTSSIAYALALAAYTHYERVLVYGVEMASDTEYQYQRDCVAYWVGFLRGRGIEVERHCADPIFNRPLYGYDGLLYQDLQNYLARADELHAQIQDARAKVGRLEHTLHTCYRAQKPPGDAIGELLDAERDLGELEGALAENDRYLGKLQIMQQAGAAVFIDRSEFENAAGKVKHDVENYAQEIHRSAGRLDYVLHVWTVTQQLAALEQVKTFAKAHLDAGYNFGLALGRHGENHRRARELDERIKAAGGAKAVEYIQEQL